MDYKLISPIKYPSAIQTIFFNRGFDVNDIERYVHPTEDEEFDPERLDNCIEGVKLLIKHINNNSKVFLQVDSDCDGFTSSAILINYLNCLFPHFAQSNITYRLHEGKQHGIILDTIPEGTQLVIIPDAGSNQFEEHAALRERGIDVLVIDHHESEKVSEDAVIINNQLCDYPNKTLSGAGVVYKFCQSIDRLLGRRYSELFLDLAALGMVADVMDLREFETRYLVSKGFKNVRNPLFVALSERNSYSMNDTINPMTVAFYIAPYINAICRSGTIEEKTCVFESMLEFKANEKVPSTKRGEVGRTELRVLQAVRYMTNVKSRQKKMRDAGYEAIESLIEENNLLDNKILVACLPKDVKVESTLRGLIANQLMSKYQRPVLVLSEMKDSWEGSGRNYDKMATFTEFKDFVARCPGVMYAEGHQGAFGCGITKKDYNDFIDYSNAALKDIDFSPCYGVDFIFQGNNVSKYDILEIGNLADLWGKGLDEPYVALENVPFTKDDIQLLSPDRRPTLKLTHPNGIEFVKFGIDPAVYEELKKHSRISMNIVGRCSVNMFGGAATGQILIEDYEVIQAVDYDF